MEGIFDAKELAAYICKKYLDKYNGKISPVRLQKTLYFSFAYWGGFVRKGKVQQEKEIDISGLSEYLFKNKIEAWVYGPVIPDVYFETNLEKYENSNMFENKTIVKEFVDNVIEDTFNVNDFRLVEISHNDKAWKSKFDYDEQFHNNEIIKEEIIEEYARK